MENKEEKKLSHKAWRKIAKKERRRKIRKKFAKERDEDEIRLRETLERSENYLKWIEEQANLEKEKEIKEQEEIEKSRQLWLDNEIKAQEEFKIIQEKRAKSRQERLQQEELIRKEFEEKREERKRKNDEIKRQQEEELKRQMIIENEINSYIDDGTKTPEILKVITDSHPSKEQCHFFSKTAACKFGDSCSRNHRRYGLTNIIIIPGFYNHFSLEKNSKEYDTDINLEYENHETRRHYREFWNDILPEFESYGKIKTFKCCCNSSNHLRGNVYIEYYSKRDAARAWRKIKGRFYAGRQLNCEFAYLTSWNNAVCGISKCPKGTRCNFLHTFRNPHDDYNVMSPPKWRKKEDTSDSSRTNEKRSTSTWENSTRSNSEDRRNWRWSESPENHRESSKRHRSTSSQRSSSRRNNSRSPSKSEKHDDSCSDDERKSRRLKRHKHRDKENKSDRSSSRSTSKKSKKKKSKKKKKIKKTKWDDENVATASSCSDCSTDEFPSPKQSIDKNNLNWDTSDSEEEISKPKKS